MADSTFLHDLVTSFGNWFEDEQRLQDGRMTADLHPYTALFSPIQVNKLKLKNRIVMGPMGNVCMADETGRPGNKMIAYFAARAKGGVGLITTGLGALPKKRQEVARQARVMTQQALPETRIRLGGRDAQVAEVRLDHRMRVEPVGAWFSACTLPLHYMPSILHGDATRTSRSLAPAISQC